MLCCRLADCVVCMLKGFGVKFSPKLGTDQNQGVTLSTQDQTLAQPLTCDKNKPLTILSFYYLSQQFMAIVLTSPTTTN